MLRHGTVLTMDESRQVLTDADVLVVGIGSPRSEPVWRCRPDPGDRSDRRDRHARHDRHHRHLWQTAMRGYGADWTLTNTSSGTTSSTAASSGPRTSTPATSAPSRRSTRVATTVDWSHGLQTVEHAAAALEALKEVPARFVLAYGNIQAGPWEWTAQPEVRRFSKSARQGR